VHGKKFKMCRKGGEGLTSFKVEQKPSVAEIEVGVVAVLSHVIKQLRV